MTSSLTTAIGLMSGTSMDGIDVALVRTDGKDQVETGPSFTVPYDTDFRARLRTCLGKEDIPIDVERDITLLHVAAVQAFLTQNRLQATDIDLIGFHGHTTFHAPQQRLTRQIGYGALLAAETGIPVVADFRGADVKAGGQGAPLVPVFHQALAAKLKKPVMVLNIGGVANVTWIGPDTLVAFDTGPGNALIDDWMLHHTGQPFDPQGQYAARGRVHDTIVKEFLQHPYFSKLPPKSLDRKDFSVDCVKGLSLEDGAATLTACTAQAAVSRALAHLSPVSEVLVTGGGRHNKTLMAMMEKIADCAVKPVEAVGWNGDALEAQAFGYLAVRSTLDLPLTFPSTTGVPIPLTGGRLYYLGDKKRGR